MNLRVLYLTMNPNTISTTAPTMGWLTHLRGQGLEPVVAHNTLGDFHRWLCARDIPSYHVPMPMPDKLRPWAFLKSILALRSIVKRHRIDVIHANEQNVYLHASAIARWSRLPAVTSIHFSMGREHCEWVFGGRRVPRRVYFVSAACRDFCRASLDGVVPEENWRVLLNGLELDEIKPDSSLRSAFRETHRLDGTVAIGAACALRPVKQVEHIVEAIARLPDPRLRFVLAGAAVPGHEAYAEKLIADTRVRLGERFVYLGHLNDVRDFFSGIDIFANASQEESSGISVLQSLCAEHPVVGYPSVAVVESVTSDCGEMVPQDDIGALSRALGEWANNPPRMKAAGIAGRQRIAEFYDIRAISMFLWNDYLTLVPEARLRP